MLNYLTGEVMAQTDLKEIMRGGWPRLAPSSSSGLNVLRRSKVLRRIPDRFAPGFRLYHLRQFLGTREDCTVETTTFGGHRREYRLYKGFLESVARSERPSQLIDGMIRSLNAYEADHLGASSMRVGQPRSARVKLPRRR